MARSNVMETPEEIIPQEFPFQKVCCDYFTFNNNAYLVLVDRYSNWPIVFKEPGKAENLVSRLRDIFETFGVPEEITTDGGPVHGWCDDQIPEVLGSTPLTYAHC